jgi:hypothetical protein
VGPGAGGHGGGGGHAGGGRGPSGRGSPSGRGLAGGRARATGEGLAGGARDGEGAARGEGARAGEGRARCRGHAGRKKGWGTEGERGRGRGEAHLGDPNSGDHRLQTLGHHGERERGGRGRGRLLRGRNQMRQMDQGEGGALIGRAGGTGGAWAGLGQAEPGWAKPRIQTHDTHDHQWKPITNRNPKRNETNTRLTTTSDKEICFSMMQHP